MSDLFNQPALIAQMAWYLVPGMVLVASLLGSTHCVGMCGGIVMALAPGRNSQLAYHGGRLLGYLSLGALAGLAGERLLAGTAWLTAVSAILMALILIRTAVKVWRGEPMHLNLPAWLQGLIQKPLSQALARSRSGEVLMAFPVGLLTMFLPCGWLYTFVIGALSTRSVWLGALYLFAFWLGSVPMLAFGPGLLKTWLTRRSPRQRQWVAGLFLLAGLLTLGLRMNQALANQAGVMNGVAPEACHDVGPSHAHQH